MDAAPIGPISTEAVAEAILSGRFSPGCWVAGPRGSRWLRATDVPVIATLINGLPTRRNQDSGICRRMNDTTEAVPKETRFDHTLKWTSDNDTALSPPIAPSVEDERDGPVTERIAAHERAGASIPPSSSTPPPPDQAPATVELDTPRRTQSG